MQKQYTNLPVLHRSQESSDNSDNLTDEIINYNNYNNHNKNMQILYGPGRMLSTCGYNPLTIFV